MNGSETYTMAYWGVLIALVILLVQWVIASGQKAKQPGAVPGKIDDSLSHSSFVFRAHRTLMNSLENYPLMLGTVFLAFFIGVSAFWTGIFIWIFAIARLIHMVLYYAIATEKNPSPRSYFFMIGLAANVALLVLCGITLI
ncbi:putative MAPEG superfamily protein [Idiomarina loihiensis]|uniref:MAPEG family protein n=1 Tax=Idiomarina TaxID=135575 RepID=UPI000D71AC67|nr:MULTISPECIES: MAPEG family protein [Idiomarina]PWW35301.1 putative MAPEG superfamily protein [Idiomarina loihiensis]TDP45241.1 putative MAPEG superfamily protein [Idiomarina loihiensis]TDS21038.1 putative MAPEG superfamily protein [Idiomarina sp. H2]